MRDHAEVLYVLHIVLIEIRATESLERAHIYSDVVHNVPTMVRAGATEEKVVAEVMLKAKRHGVDRYFAKLFEMAKSK